MLKRLLSLCLVLALVVGAIPMLASVGTSQEVEAASTNLVEMPSNNGVTNNATYTLGAGTDAEVTVITDWRSTSLAPTDTITPKYIAIHCMGNYASGADAAANHNYGKTAESACWHYTVGEDVIYQLLADNRKGWHVGTSTTGAPSNSNSIGLELVVSNFPADSSFAGEHWSDGTAIMQWWEDQFDQTMKNAAMLTLVLCKRWGLDWQTAVKQHWDSHQTSYAPGGKDCPMQMRATYDPATNTFAAAGSGQYADGRDGYFWQMFWGYLTDYANGLPNTGTGGTVASKIGTYVATPSDGLNVRSSTDTSSSANIVGSLAQGEMFEVTELVGGNWAKIRMQDGTEGYASAVNYGEFIGVDAQAYNVAPNSDGLIYSYDTDGGLKIQNPTDSQGQLDLMLPYAIGTRTTPYMSLQVTPITGDGYYFGITQYGSGYFMMRDCNSGDQLVVEDTAPYMVNQETLEINVNEWWKPDADYSIDQVRFYIAPNSSIKINYFYFAATAGKVIDSRYNLMANADNVTLMQPDGLEIADYLKKGRYEYDNGMLTVTADTDAGFDVVFNINETFDVATIKRFLVGIEANTSFNITLTLTNAVGTGEVSLVNDFWPAFAAAHPADGYIPGPWEGTAGLDLYNYFDYNGVIPADGTSTITQVKVSLGSAGTSYFNYIQIASNDRLVAFPDGVSKSGESDGTGVEPEPTPDPDILKGDVNQDGAVTTADAREILLLCIDTSAITEELLALADYDESGDVTTADARELLMNIVG